MAKLWDDAELASYAASYPTANQINNAAQAAQKKRGGLVDTLKSAIGGFTTGVKDLGTSAVSTLGGAATNNAITAGIDALINKKSFAQAAADANKRQDDFTKWLYDTNSTKDAYAKNLGTALSGTQAALDFVPGVGQLAPVNALQGAMSGAAEQLKANGENADVNQLKNDAIVGAATGAVAGKFGNALGKLGANSAKGIGRALATQVGKGAATGAVAGATGGGLSTVLNGGTLGEALANAGYGAKQGALAGGTMAGAMGLGGAALQKRAGKGQTVTPDVEEAVTVNKKRIAPTVEAEEVVTATPTRKGITITDYNAGEETIPVNIKKNQQGGRGQYIDGIVKGKNLPEAEIDYNKRFANEYDAPYNDKYTLADYISKGNMGDDSDIFSVLEPAVGKENIQKLKNAAYEGAEFNNAMAGGQYGMYDSKSQLPALNRQEAYNLFGKEVAEELPSYMLSNKGRSFSDPAWGETFPQFTGGTGNGSTSISADDILELYKNAANSDNRRVYTTENIGMGLAANPELATTMTKQLVDFYSPSKKIDIAKTLSSAQDVPITSRSIAEPQYTRSTIKARNYDTPTANTAKAVAEMPEAQIAKKSGNIVGAQESVLPPKQTAQIERQRTVAKQKQGAELLAMYGTIDKPTRRAVKDAGAVLVDLYDNYGIKTPADVQYAANYVTGKDGLVSKMTRELAGKAERVDTSINENWLDDLIASNGLTDADAKSVKSQVVGALKRTGADGFSDGNTTLDTMKQLESIKRSYKGEDGSYHNETSKDKFKANVIQGVRDELQDRLWNAAGDASQVITAERLNTLKSFYPDNQQWQNFVDNTLAKARNGQELRAAMKPLVDGATILKGSNMSAGGVGDTVVNLAKAGSAKGATKNIAVAAVDKLVNSDKARQKRAAKYAQEAQIAGKKLAGELPANYKQNAIAGKLEGTKNAVGTVADKVSALAAPIADAANNDYLYNMRYQGDTDFRSLGDIVTRNANQGIAQEQNARTQQQAQEALANAQAEQEAAQNLANEQYVAQRNAEAQALGGGGFGMAQPQSQLDRISTAMELALNAGDVNAYNQLADLYTQAYKIEQMRNPQATATEAKTLSANQSKALTGLQQLDALEQMKPGARTALANSPLGGLVDLTGGDTYDSQAESLALTIGFLLSGANVKESEAKKIAKSYIPTVYDSDTVRQQKLSRARELLNSYVSDTTALQQ